MNANEVYHIIPTNISNGAVELIERSMRKLGKIVGPVDDVRIGDKRYLLERRFGYFAQPQLAMEAGGQ